LIKIKDLLYERLLLDRCYLEINRSYLILGADILEAALDRRTRDFIELRSFTLTFYAS
jgi:hypothetical protein